MPSSTRSRGVIYVAHGAAHVETARRSARSLRRHCPDLPVHLFSNAPDDSGVFDETHLLSESHKRSKVDVLPLTPFQDTLYLDNDTLVREDISDLFLLLERFDIAAASVVLWHRPRHRKRYKVAVPDTFPEANSGVLLYRSDTEKMQAFLRQWQTDYHARRGVDQVTLRELLWTSDVQFFVLPEQFNKRVVEINDLIYTDRPRPRIWHLPLLQPQKSALWRWLANRVR